MKSEKKIKVLGVGSPILDILINVSNEFIHTIEGAKGGMMLVNSGDIERIISKVESAPSLIPGGSAGNTIFGLARLGMATAFLGKTGDDNEGLFYIKRYEEMGGDTSRFKKTRGFRTGRCLSLVTPDSERTMRTDLGAAATMALEDVSHDDFRDITHVHIEGYLLFNQKLILEILGLAKQKNCTISLDLASFEVVEASKPILPEILEKYVDIVLANEEEAKAFSGSENPGKALDSLSKLCDIAAVKFGKKGAVIRRGKEEVEVDAMFVSNPIDTTGAGDLWASGFLYGLLNGKPLKTCGSYASLLGAEVVKVMGAEIPDKAWCGIRKKIKSC